MRRLGGEDSRSSFFIGPFTNFPYLMNSSISEGDTGVVGFFISHCESFLERSVIVQRLLGGEGGGGEGLTTGARLYVEG